MLMIATGQYVSQLPLCVKRNKMKTSKNNSINKMSDLKKQKKNLGKLVSTVGGFHSTCSVFCHRNKVKKTDRFSSGHQNRRWG